MEVQRFNLSSAPAEFVKSKPVTEYLQKFGPEKLPVATVEDMIVIAGRYPTNALLRAKAGSEAEWIDRIGEHTDGSFTLIAWSGDLVKGDKLQEL